MFRGSRTLLTTMVVVGTLVTGTTLASAAPAPESAAQAARALVAHAPNDIVDCFGNVTLWSDQNHHFVSTELGDAGNDYQMLRARATAVGAWERYGICRDENTNTTSIWSTANGLFVSAELGFPGAQQDMLRARTPGSALGSWEVWYSSADPSQCGSTSGTTTYLANGGNFLYVAEEDGYPGIENGMLRARTPGNALGSWEVFNWCWS